MKTQHLIDFTSQAWTSLYDEHEKKLSGILGKAGVVAQGNDGVEMGLDLITLQPGAAFPPHEHEGDHILYALSGRGHVTAGNVVTQLVAGSACYVSAKEPHHVSNPFDEPFTLLAFGHPHKALEALDRMKLVETDQPWATIFPED